MGGHNKITIVGNLGRDAEFGATKGGTNVLRLNVAVSTRQKRGGEWGEVTDWFSVSVFGTRAEALNRLGLSKGTKVLVTGRVSARAYMGKDGEPKASLDVMADDLELLGGGRGGQARGDDGGRSYGASQTQTATSDDFPADDFGDDSIPF